ncbi:MAG: hypothetical protein ACKVUS_21380 [Saprospiraceae bacterium]
MQTEAHYANLFLEPIRKCKEYRPKFGVGAKSEGLSLGQFLGLYGADPFYAWIGLDSDLMYAAHKAAGGMTSVYRQIGIGCEHLFKAVLSDLAQYEKPEYAGWSYTTRTSAGQEKTLSLDGRLDLNLMKNTALSARLRDWTEGYCKQISAAQIPANGVVFEVRQGYKSKDSKRQNADIDNATVAWANGYLPVITVFSTQIDGDLVLRYRNNRCGVLTGILSSDPFSSFFAFSEQVLGYDLAGFFRRNSLQFKDEIQSVLQTLLNPDGTAL